MTNRSRLDGSHLLMLALGTIIGVLFTTSRPSVMRAVGGDRSQESILATGPMSLTYNRAASVQVTQDAIYYLDYRATKLIGTVPVYRNSAASGVIHSFAERDLVADFKLDLDSGPNPHFLMTTGSVNTNSNNAFSEGLALLFVYETTTRQVGTYRMNQFQAGSGYQHKLDLVEMKSFGKPTSAH